MRHKNLTYFPFDNSRIANDGIQTEYRECLKYPKKSPVKRKFYNCPKCGKFVKIKEGSRSGYGIDGYYWDIYYHCKKCGDGHEGG